MERSHDILWRPSRAADLARYAFAAMLVAGTATAASLALGAVPPGEVASENEDAVLIDLPPAPQSAAAPSEAPVGERQEASEAVPPAPPPEEKPPEQAPDETPPMPEAAPARGEGPPPPPPEGSKRTPGPRASPPATAAPTQEAMAPAGSPAPTRNAEPLESQAARRRAAHALSRWQQALLVRLEGAKRGVEAGGEYGTVTVAFTINRQGRLVSSHVARGSRSERLDRAAIALLARAAPFPTPPPSAPEPLSFTVPIAFARGR